MKTTSTGLSIPPVRTGSIQGSPGRRRKMWGSAGDEGRTVRPFVGLLGEGSLGPVDPSVQSQVGAMQIVGATGEGLAREPFLPPVGDAVIVRIGQLPDAGGRRHVKRAVEPERALGNHHAVGERCAAVETSVSVRVFQALDAVRFPLQLLFDRVVGSGGLGYVESPLLVEIDGNGTLHQRRPGDEFHLKPLGHRQRGVIGRVVDPDEQVQQNGSGQQDQPALHREERENPVFMDTVSHRLKSWLGAIKPPLDKD